MLHVAGFGAFLAIGDPVGIGFERIASPLAVGLTLEAPEEHDLIDRPDIGREDADRLTECLIWIGIPSASYNLSHAPRRPGTIV